MSKWTFRTSTSHQQIAVVASMQHVSFAVLFFSSNRPIGHTNAHHSATRETGVSLLKSSPAIQGRERSVSGMNHHLRWNLGSPFYPHNQNRFSSSSQSQNNSFCWKSYGHNLLGQRRPACRIWHGTRVLLESLDPKSQNFDKRKTKKIPIICVLPAWQLASSHRCFNPRNSRKLKWNWNVLPHPANRPDSIGFSSPWTAEISWRQKY